MNIFQAEFLSKSYGLEPLFENISFSIDQGQKLALIAPNGAGKTSLLNIIAGLDSPDSGRCTFRNDLKIAYLPQEPFFSGGLLVRDALMQGDSEIVQTVREYEELYQDSQQKINDEQSRRLQFLSERMDALQAWDYEQKIKQVLDRLRIGKLSQPVEQLSGGQRKRLALARILIEDVDFLLLDEPTNHLDLDMIEWLESYLGRKKLSMLMVTHDRYFLDAVCDGIIELHQGAMYSYPGSYARYLEKKQEMLQAQSAQSEKAQNLLRTETEWMRRSPAARTTKSKARIQAYYDLKERSRFDQEEGMGEIRAGMERLGNKIMELHSLHKAYPGQTVVNDFSYVFRKGERIGIVGPNGCGKTSLLRLIAGEEKPDSGYIEKGQTLKLAYYRQDGLNADDPRKIIEVISEIAEQVPTGNSQRISAAQLLQHFHFPYSRHHSQVSRLSGGEKRRLYLVSLLIQQPNFLLLDEPTNDLDIHTLNTLEDFLADFKGCLIMVSHDRYMLDRLTDQLFIFEEQGIIRGYVGNYSHYRQTLRQEEAERRQSEKTTEKPSDSVAASRKKDKQKLSYKEQKELDALNLEIEILQREKDSLLEKLNQGISDTDALREASERYGELEKLLDEKEWRWLDLSERS